MHLQFAVRVRVRELRVRVRLAFASIGLEGRMSESKVKVLATLLPRRIAKRDLRDTASPTVTAHTIRYSC